ncbi:MAG: magnesium transporter [Candidatus Omnitrophica bacterium]|nr:magnesium transporter [Candidatus Omnitrophota bacterium]
MLKLFLFLSEILDNPVVAANGDVIGKLFDVPMKVSPEEIYPRSKGILIYRGFFRREYAFIRIEDVKEIDDILKLKIDAEKVAFLKSCPSQEFTLRHDILDRQVVDTENRKVVRVNDCHLLRVDNNVYLAHVDVGMRALIRRLEWTRCVDFFIKMFSPRNPYLTQEEFIPWKNTQVFTAGRQKNVLRIDVAWQKLAHLPPTELADIMQDLDIFGKLALFKSLDVSLQRTVFADLATQEKQDLVDHLEDKEAANLIENIPADEATDLLMTFPKEMTLRLMRYMETKQSKKLRKLLGFAKDSAGGLMTTEYLYLNQSASVGDALQLVKNNVTYPGNIQHIYIVDDFHRLVGMTSFRRYIHLAPEVPIMDTCFPLKVFVRTSDGMEEIALLLEKYKFTSIPVLSDDDILQGAVTTDDVMEALISIAWTKYKEKLA